MNCHHSAAEHVDEQRASAEAKQKRQDELYGKAQSGENVQGWDWGLDDD